MSVYICDTKTSVYVVVRFNIRHFAELLSVGEQEAESRNSRRQGVEVAGGGGRSRLSRSQRLVRRGAPPQLRGRWTLSIDCDLV